MKGVLFANNLYSIQPIAHKSASLLQIEFSNNSGLTYSALPTKVLVLSLKLSSPWLSLSP